MMNFFQQLRLLVEWVDELVVMNFFTCGINGWTCNDELLSTAQIAGGMVGPAKFQELDRLRRHMQEVKPWTKYLQ